MDLKYCIFVVIYGSMVLAVIVFGGVIVVVA